ncbi:MAG: DUF3147 family protein [Leptospira sp.]|nr:DUF3147 family protein [Leptospira sp.]
MLYLLFKYFATAFLVIVISEIAKRNDRLGGLIAALPIVTLLTMIWLKIENTDNQKIANHAYYTFWYVIPTLPMFLLFPKFISLYGFWIAISLSIIISISIFIVWNFVLAKWGIKLL